jgi:hypothetical protein
VEVKEPVVEFANKIKGLANRILLRPKFKSQQQPQFLKSWHRRALGKALLSIPDEVKEKNSD